MTGSSDQEDEEVAVNTPDFLPPDSIQETISKQWLNNLDEDNLAPPRDTSSRLETGVFLQQLTNSVSRALHKQHCTCNGKAYTSDELRAISNPAMFAPGPTGTSTAPATARSDPGTVVLPPIDDASKSITSDIMAGNGSPLKAYLEREIGKKLGVPAKRGAPGTKRLGQSLVVDREKEELKLPYIMDIMDINGNNWKIMQDVSRQRRHRTARFDKRLFDGQSVTLQDCRSPPKTPSGNSKTGALSDGYRQVQGPGGNASDAAIEAVTRSNSPQGVEAVANEDLHAAADAERAARGDEISLETAPDHLPELAPRCTLVQINQSPRLNFDSTQATYDEAERRALLLQLNSAVRTRKMPYMEFLKRVSSLAPSFKLGKGGDKRTRTSSMEKAFPDRTKRQDTRHSVEQTLSRDLNTLNPETATTANTLASSSYTGIYAKDPHAMFPPELQTLYARGGLKVTTLKIDVGDSLPENFLTKEKEELRVLYPMYGSRVEQEQESVSARMNSLQSKVDMAQAESPRDLKTTTAVGHDRRTLLFPNNTVPPPADPDDFKLKFKVRKGTDGRSREGKIYCLQGRQSISREGEIVDLPEASCIRRISVPEGRDSSCPSRNFPKQPPTTPADDRRQSQDTPSEVLLGRSFPSSIPESRTAPGNTEEEEEEAVNQVKNHERSTSTRLGRIQEDPLDTVSHANTYGTEMLPRRLTDTFGEDPAKEEVGLRAAKEYVHVVVPTNRKASGKTKHVSWDQRGRLAEGDDTTEFTKSRETLQSIQTNERPPTPDRAQLAFTISDVSEANPTSRGGDELKPAIKILEIDDSSVGTFESPARRPVPYDTYTGAHSIQGAGSNPFGGGARKDGTVAVSTQKVVFVSPIHNQKKHDTS